MPAFGPNRTRSFCGVCPIVRWPNSTVRWTTPGAETCGWSGERWRGTGLGEDRDRALRTAVEVWEPGEWRLRVRRWTITHRGADSPPPDDLARVPVDRRGDLATGPSRTSPA